MEIKALVIDLDGCLYPSSNEDKADRISFRKIDEYLKMKGLLEKLPNRVAETKRDYLSQGLTSELVEYLSINLKINEKSLSRYVFGTNPRDVGIKRNPKLANLFSNLSRYYDIYIFSNSPGIWVNRTLDLLGVGRYIKKENRINMDILDKHIKPNPDAFRFMLKKVGVRKNELLFIDDRKRNIDGAKRMGINSRISKWGSSNKSNSTYYILAKMLDQKRQKKL